MKPDTGQSNATDSKFGAKNDMKSLPLDEVGSKPGSSPAGLSQAEAQKRLARYGPNTIEEKKTSPLLKLLGYFW
jgi:H+-transporting ATPase